MPRGPFARPVASLLILVGAGLVSQNAFAQDRMLRAESTYFGKSLEQYCQQQLGRTDLDDGDLSQCDRIYQAEIEDFLVIDDGGAPLARRDEQEGPASDLFLLDEPEQRGRLGRARKKTTTEEDDFDFEEDEADLEEEFGFDFEFEGGEVEEDPIEDFDLDPIDDPELEPLGEAEDDLSEFEGRDLHQGSAQVKGEGSSAPVGIQLDVVGKAPLADNYEPYIVATDRDAVVVELPLLLGRSRADFDGITYCVVAEVFVDGKKVSESRQQVSSSSLAEFGPSFMFIKMLAPVPAKSGNLEVRVSKASSMSAKAALLFSRVLPYSLP